MVGGLSEHHKGGNNKKAQQGMHDTSFLLGWKRGPDLSCGGTLGIECPKYTPLQDSGGIPAIATLPPDVSLTGRPECVTQRVAFVLGGQWRSLLSFRRYLTRSNMPKERCEEQHYAQAAKHYDWALGELTRQRNLLHKDCYDGLYRVVENAREDCERLRKAIRELNYT